MTYNLLYHSEVRRKDLKRIPKNIKERIKRAIEERLIVNPIKYGLPLKRSLQGYRKLRIGDYKVVYKIEEDNIIYS
jgi:mRNA interferase RelE/StbE